MHRVGSVMLERLLNADEGDYRGRTLSCDKGHDAEFKEYREKELLTVLGPVSVTRAYYHDDKWIFTVLFRLLISIMLGNTIGISPR